MKKYVACLLAALTLLSLAGCGSGDTPPAESTSGGVPVSTLLGMEVSSDEPFNLSVLVGEVASAPAHDFTDDTLQDLVALCCTQGGRLSLIEADGRPFVLYSDGIAQQQDSFSDRRKSLNIQNSVQQVSAFLLENAVPRTNEYDLVSALELSARGLRDYQGTRTIYITGNGLSTAGCLSFTTGILRADPVAVTDALEKQGNLVDLAGCHVVWAGLTDTAGEQDPLTLSAKANLEAIWEEYLTRCGASSVYFCDTFSSGQELTDAPTVTPVPVAEDDPFQYVIEDTLILDETKVRFLGDQAVYADTQQAEDALRPVAAALNASPSAKILIVGCTASGEESFCQKLSEDRSRAVMETLCSLGVSEQQMTTVGVGFHSKWHIDDLNENGTQNSNAAANRIVVILPASSPDAQALLHG